ncbi:LacI family transcriptional regulator, kdg operon repressor [Salibacterium qingdaonense]|uniref:LacI family transcriptional regulator, kdg operon repressor n=2 Tax=Salibacterium qingdaonense TaxID=266892 RepID=A0A1I4LDK0_9BACI|nr:LacI family transcriptional regulator, kdg operon repressor [Salibacterium qingdaonense]
MGSETRKRIEEAVLSLEYKPNAVARGLKQKKTTTIGIIVANILHRFSTQVSRAIEDICQEYGYHTIICNADDDPEKEKRYVDMLKAKQVDGFIIIPTGVNESLYKELINERYPMVFLDRKMQSLSVPTVTLRNIKAGYEATLHLLDQNHELIAYISSPLTVSTRKERYEGYVKALNDRGMELNEHYVFGGDMEQIEGVLTEMLESEHPPTALICGNDRVLKSVLPILKQRNTAIPEELALVTFDEVEFSEFFTPTLTTVEQPAYGMGVKTAELLLNRINGKVQQDASETEEFEPKLKVRESSLFKK